MPKAAQPLAAVASRREPWHPMPWPSNQRLTSSGPRSHRRYGGMENVASSRSSETSASMS